MSGPSEIGLGLELCEFTRPRVVDLHIMRAIGLQDFQWNIFRLLPVLGDEDAFIFTGRRAFVRGNEDPGCPQVGEARRREGRL